MTTLTDFLKDWQQDALNAAYGKAATRVSDVKDSTSWGERGDGESVREVWVFPSVCVQCQTRDQRKAFTPYCSQICLEAAQRKELYDRR